ncbi:MAG: uracil-DNA glycosylase, partial [Veillonella sp.]
DGLTNRTPTKQELDLGWTYTKQLLDLFPQAQIIGVGQKASLTLSDYGINVQATLRHPANGGAGLYKQQFQAFIEEELKA